MRARLPLLLGAACLAAGAAGAAGEPPAAGGGAGDFELAAVEHVLIDDVRAAPGGEGGVDVLFRALTRYRVPVEHLRPVDVVLRQDSAELPRDTIVSLRRADEAGGGIDVVLALDNSRTMLGAPFERARAQALVFLGKLAAPDRAALVTFAGKADVVAGFDQPLEEVRTRTQALQPDKTAMSTVVFDGIYQAAELLRGSGTRGRPGFAVVFSDGRDGGSQHKEADVLALARGGPSDARLPIFTIGYEGRGADGLDALRRISAASGADTAREVEAAEFYDDLLKQMRGSFVLRFSAPLDGAPHEVALEIEGKKDARSAAYPVVQGVPKVALQTPWQLPALAAAALLLGAALFLSRRSRAGAAEDAGGGARLRFVDGPLAEREVPLTAARVRIGALADNDVAIPAPSVSRVHAEIRSEGAHWVIVDLDSTNGTRVNGAPITSAPLRPGDRIRIGQVEAVFEA